ncbi:MAG: hypothetical protein MK165_02290 [Pirellulaceae bacterium]|nr:hypothetical protein [Pirellulaceae bacterium]
MFSSLVRRSLAVLFALYGLSGVTRSDGQEIDFHRDVFPIFQQYCLRCHGEEKQAGGLRLDQRTHIYQGGDSGKNLLVADLYSNELYRRVTGKNVELQMPLDAMPLPPEAIDILRDWIQAGARWPDNPQHSTKPSSQAFWRRINWASGFYALDAFQQNYRVLLFSSFGILCLLLMIERSKKVDPDQAPTNRWRKGWYEICLRVTWSHYLIVVLLFVVVGLYQELSQLKKNPRRSFGEGPATSYDQILGTFEVASAEAQGALRPIHPPKLKMTYYRGNDERSPHLFNGGNYRTANLHIGLCDAKKNELAIGNKIQGTGFYVRLDVERAQNASPALFKPQIIDLVFISEHHSGVEIADVGSKVTRLETLETGEQWIAYHPLTLPPSDGTFTLEQEVYIYRGRILQNAFEAAYQYVIGIKLHVKNGVIVEPSEIWMAALLYPGNVVVMPKGKLPLGEWFDSRPILEIEGEHTSDPELLGLSEYESTDETEAASQQKKAGPQNEPTTKPAKANQP